MARWFSCQPSLEIQMARLFSHRYGREIRPARRGLRQAIQVEGRDGLSQTEARLARNVRRAGGKIKGRNAFAVLFQSVSPMSRPRAPVSSDGWPPSAGTLAWRMHMASPV